MTWEQKKELCTLLNASHNEKAVDLVIANIGTMDDQAWDMFLHGIILVENEIEPLLEKHKTIYEVMKNRKTDSFRTAVRMVSYEKIIEKIIK